jgi:formylglycine-generating enzyme required for sulfatase activity
MRPIDGMRPPFTALTIMLSRPVIVAVSAVVLTTLSGCSSPPTNDDGATSVTRGSDEPDPASADDRVLPPTTDEPVQTKAFRQDIEGTTHSITFMPVPGGSVVHPVTGDTVEVEPFWIAQTEITWDVFDVFRFQFDEGKTAEEAEADGVSRPSKPYIAMDRGFGYAGYPAISMSYHAAATYAAWLSEKTGRNYQVPSEVQWVHACALAAVDPAELDAHAWHAGNAGSKTHPVGATKPDALGVYDLYGNASEWCATPDGKGVTYGGSYLDDAGALGCTARVPRTYEWNASDPQFPQSKWWMADAGWVGFRLVLMPGEPQPANSDP